LAYQQLLNKFYSNNLSAQTKEEYKADDEEEEFFDGGLNGSRFESKISSEYESARPDYNYKRNQNQSGENAYENSRETNTYKELDIEVNRESSRNNSVITDGCDPDAPIDGGVGLLDCRRNWIRHKEKTKKEEKLIT